MNCGLLGFLRPPSSWYSHSWAKTSKLYIYSKLSVTLQTVFVATEGTYMISKEMLLINWWYPDHYGCLMTADTDTTILPYSQSFPHDLPRMTSLSSTGGWMTSYTTCFARKVIMTSQANTPKRQCRTRLDSSNFPTNTFLGYIGEI